MYKFLQPYDHCVDVVPDCVSTRDTSVLNLKSWEFDLKAVSQA